MSLADAFNSLLRKQSRPMSLVRMGGAGGPQTVSVRVSPSNYSRYLEGPGSTKIAGYEFILSAQALKEAGFVGAPRINDVLTDPQLGRLSIREVELMFELGANLVGYRVRTG